MLTQFRKVLAVSALAFAVSTSVFAQDKPKVAFVPQLIGIPYFNAMEAGGKRAIDDAVVVGNAQRQHQARLEGLAVPHRLHLRAHDAEDCDFRRVDDGREVGAADAAEAGDGEGGTLDVGGCDLAVAHALRRGAQLLRQFENALVIDVLDHRHHQPVRRVDRHADVIVFFIDQSVLRRI